MMKIYQVRIGVPSAEAKSDKFLISGVPNNVEAAKVGLGEKVAELEAKMEEYQFKSIGQQGATIIKLRWGTILILPWMDSNSLVWLGMTASCPRLWRTVGR